MRLFSHHRSSSSLRSATRRLRRAITPLLLLERLEDRRLLSGTLSTLAAFNYSDGSYPSANLIADSAGNLYGTTEYGGPTGNGTVFKIAAGSNTITTLATFNGTNGQYPLAGLIADKAGNLYGTTGWGGNLTLNSGKGDGTVFEIVAGSNTVTTLAEFNGTNGQSPYAGLVADAAGNLYGTTYYGGANNDGVVFEVAAGTNALTAVVSFAYTNGWGPNCGLIADSQGNLYGTTFAGGADDNGTVFAVTPSTGTLATLASFNGANGDGPVAGLVEDSAGNFYGTTENGGAKGDGAVFEVSAGNNALTILVSFNGSNGNSPVGGLIEDAAGNLYGTTENGGVTGNGTAFQVAPATGAVTTLVSFNGTSGDSPIAGLVADTSGNLYGTTQDGDGGQGNVFELSGSGFAASTAQTVYRLYSPVTNEHLYTADLNEYNTLKGYVGTWNAEGAAYQWYDGPITLDGVTDEPFYRLYNPAVKQHLWTTDLNEYTTLPTTQGWDQEGVVGYVFPTAVAASDPLYRMNYPATATNVDLHLWTTDLNEYDTNAATYGWTQEGVIGYVM